MTQKDEALKMAIEALESCDINDGYNGITQYYNEKLIDPAIQACKAALSEDKTSLSLEQATIVTQIDAVKFQEALDAMCVDEDKQIAEQSAEIAHYKAQINELRNVLEIIASESHEDLWQGQEARQALSKTAPQCLQEHDNEVIERCANVCDEMADWSLEKHPCATINSNEYLIGIRRGLVNATNSIRALKGKQNESALERMAENARELGLDYCKHGSDSACKECYMEINK